MTTQARADRLKQIQASKARLSRGGGARAEAGSGDTTSGELWLYGVVGGWWFGFDAESVSRELRGLDFDELTVRVHSPGGNAVDGIAIGNLLRNHRARVTVVVDGMAASAASMLALGGDEIVMSPGSQMMIHDVSLLTYGNAAQLRSDADWLDKQSQNYAGVYASRAGGTAAQWREAMQADNGEGTWYTAEEAVAAGLADRVGTVAAIGSPPVAPVDELEDDEAAALAAWDLDVLIHPAARAAWQAPKPPTASAGGSPNTEGGTAMSFIDDVRTKLGVTEDADEATTLAALDEALEERAEQNPPATGKATVKVNVPEGMTLIETEVLDQLREGAQKGTEARQQQLNDERDRAIDAAIKAGKTTPARREHWAKAWDADPEGVRAQLEALAPGLVPVDEIGHAGDGDGEGADASVTENPKYKNWKVS